MRKLIAATVALALTAGEVEAAVCAAPDDVVAIHTAALQQEMMVAAFMCRDVAAYNNFVLSHQAALQDADRFLMAFFERTSPQNAFDSYNLYKTELANAASLASVRDGRFCQHVNADFAAATGRPLDQVLAAVPFPADTGSVFCPWTGLQTVAAPPSPAKKRVRHRTWLGRLVDALFH